MNFLLKYKLSKFLKTTVNYCLRLERYFNNELIIEQKNIGLSSKLIRKSFIDYFVNEYNHLWVKSSPVLPQNDSSLLFVSAGMTQFKPIFLNRLSSTDPMNGYQRCVNSQKCIRVGGKHCDFDTVGRDSTHHTFFEMLGNWSFGDYYKKESCFMAWNLLTKVFKIDSNRLIVTYFGGDKHLGLEPDLETKEIWHQIGLPESRVIPLGSRDNFWEMGETGPCGICTEIHYILNQNNVLSSHTDLLNNSIEIWNIVFMQFDKKSNGELSPLHNHFVDTGMGLERILSIVQNVNSNYETDLFVPYFQTIKKLTQCKSYSNSMTDPLDISYRILADHSRMLTIAISDGLIPDDRSAGYLLRKVIRRSIDIVENDFNATNSHQILSELVFLTSQILGEAFPEVNHNLKLVTDIIALEIDFYKKGITKNKRLVHALSGLQTKYTINLGNDLIIKFNKIKEFIEKNPINENTDKNYYSKHLLYMKDILCEKSLAIRHELPLHLIEEIDLLLNEIQKPEEKSETTKKCLIESLSKEFEEVVNSNSSEYFVHRIKCEANINIVFKIGLDYFGHKPSALFYVCPENSYFYAQFTVPNDYQNYLKANEWMAEVMSKLSGIEMTSQKRIHKLSTFKCDSVKLIDTAISSASKIANINFRKRLP